MTLFDDDQTEETASSTRGSGSGTLNLYDDMSETAANAVAQEEPYVISQAEPEPYTETARKSGLAWSAGVAFFGAVGFMLILGWGFDVLFGSSPWGVVGGIVLGSIIGFLQFFRISSQIFNK